MVLQVQKCYRLFCASSCVLCIMCRLTAAEVGESVSENLLISVHTVGVDFVEILCWGGGK